MKFAEHMHILIDGKNVSYERKGDAPRVLLLVHGWGGSSKSLESLFTLLSNDFTTLAIDLPGFGGSDLPEPNWGVAEYGTLVVNFLKELGIKNCIYFGHSFGGALGVYIAANYPEYVTDLILSAPSFRRTPHIAGAEQKLASVYKTLRFPNSRILKYFYYKIFFPKSDLLKYPRLEENFRKIVSEDLTPLLPRIDQRTLILWGDLDNYVPISDAYILRDGIKTSELIEYKNFGHGFPISEVARVYKTIMEFLN